MIIVEDADRIIMSHLYQPFAERVPLDKANGRVLRENIQADRPFPPFDRVSMDGIAIRFDEFDGGQRTFKIEGIAGAGAPVKTLQSPANCLEVMTGAIAPEGTDTVIRYEDLIIENGEATIQIDEISKFQNVHGRGLDRNQDEIIVREGIRITPAEIGVAASAGMSFIQVASLPRIVVISTGDELVDIDTTPLPYQIRKSNEYQISAALESEGILPDRKYVKDEEGSILKLISKCLIDYDVMIISGGVSAGKFDFIPKALAENGVEQHFHKIKQRPGKPLWFGTSADNSCTIFALPGNPVSSFMCSIRYVIPWIKSSLDIPVKPLFAVLAEDYEFKPDLTYFLQVRTQVDPGGTIYAYPETGGGSGDLANLVRADSFLELPGGRNQFKAGDSFPLFPFR